MKALALIGVLLLSTAHIFAQGSVVFSNSGGTAITLSSGRSVPIGSAYQVELMYAPDGTATRDFDSMAVRVGAPANFGPTPGFFSGGGRTINSIQPAGGFGLFQVRGWETAYGNSFNEVCALQNANAELAKSGIVRVDTGNPLIGEPAASLVAAGLQGFVSVTCSPEPTASAVGILGIIGLFFAFRRTAARSIRDPLRQSSNRESL
jgi:hypothetical protein